jgi:hypothetical protein
MGEVFEIIMLLFRNLAEEVLNCWLSYTMSQPVQFDLGVLFLFALQYIGIRAIWNYMTYLLIDSDKLTSVLTTLVNKTGIIGKSCQFDR